MLRIQGGEDSEDEGEEEDEDPWADDSRQVPTPPPMTVSSYARLSSLSPAAPSLSLSSYPRLLLTVYVEVPTDECVEVGSGEVGSGCLSCACLGGRERVPDLRLADCAWLTCAGLTLLASLCLPRVRVESPSVGREVKT